MMDWNNAWIGGNQPPAATGLMAPWSTSWGMTPENMIQNEVAPAPRPVGTGGTAGTAGTRGVVGNPGTATPTSQATKDRVRDSLTGSIRGNVVNTGLKTALGLGLGMPTRAIAPAAIGSLVSPGAVGNVLGGAINAALGTQPEGFFSKAIAKYGVPALAGMTLGPVGGLMGGMFGGLISDAVMDGLDMRSREDVRDDYEDQSGYFGGRNAYADRKGLEQKAARVREALPNSMAAIRAMDQAIAATRALEQKRGITPTYGMEPGGFSAGRTYGGWASPGGPSVNGARAVDAGYGANMGGFAGLGIGNPTSYGGGSRDGSTGGPGRGGRGDSTGTGGGYSDGRGGVSGL